MIQTRLLIGDKKDSSQETVISLIGMLAGTLVVSYVSSPLATWSCLLVLLTVHLLTNYAAVRAVNMDTLNRQRACLLFSSIIADASSNPSLKSIAQQERIFENDGTLRWRNGPVIGHAAIGVPLQAIVNSLSRHPGEEAEITSVEPHNLFDAFEDEYYILWFAAKQRQACIVLKDGASPESQLKSWMHALLVAQCVAQCVLKDEVLFNDNPQAILELLRQTLDQINARWDRTVYDMERSGWNTSIASLETGHSRRIRFRKEK